MRRVTLLASAAAISLASLPAAYAQGRSENYCPPDHSVCVNKDNAGQGQGKGGQGKGGPGKSSAEKTPGKSGGKSGGKDGHRQTAQAGPKKGDNARGGQPFQRASNSRFQPPPKGQEYRVVNDHLVLADSQTLRVVAVIGLLSSLLN